LIHTQRFEAVCTFVWIEVTEQLPDPFQRLRNAKLAAIRDDAEAVIDAVQFTPGLGPERFGSE
jgi:hypothetical protein